MVDMSIFDALVVAVPVALVILLLYYLFTLEGRYTKYYEGIKDTEWVVGRWSSPSDIFMRYWLFLISFLVPVTLWDVFFSDKLVYGLLLFIVWSVCYVFLIYHFMVRPTLKDAHYKARNRELMPGEVTSYIGMVLDDMGIPHERYTFEEYKESGPDARLIWEMKWDHPSDFLYDLHPGLSTDRTYSIVIGEFGDVGISYSQIRLTPYDEETAPFFDKLSDEIDRVLF